ncbi:hypothetical protein JHK82_054300 [Glycine max]|nr:hypothetical protein JHK85_055104 [Glycine max]KAG5084130.1 hypothetical protein JHK84_054168 [Glycine max]KAG5086903.1 hypothetical protein JHK82_054300 [Glycine max]
MPVFITFLRQFFPVRAACTCFICSLTNKQLSSYVVTELWFNMTFSCLFFLLSVFSTTLLLPCHSHHHPHSATHNYRDALTKSIIFFEGQRSGKLPSNQRMPWRRDSGLSDGSAMHVDLVGGYYDVGDNVKFGFPMAFTTTMLSWSVIEFGGVMKETAAALAVASLVFKKTDPTYSKTLIRRAIRVFQFADKYRGPYSNGLKPIVCPFYCSYSGYQDELLWGATWLHKATKNPMYLNYIKVNGKTLGVADSDNTFGWDNKHVGARILLSKVQTLHDYKGHADNFICSVIPGSSSSQFSPGGLLFKMGDSNMQYVTSTSFILLAYAKYLTKAHVVVNCGGLLARRQPFEDVLYGGVRSTIPAKDTQQGLIAAVRFCSPWQDPMLSRIQCDEVAITQPQHSSGCRCWRAGSA